MPNDPLWKYREDDPDMVARLAKEIGAEFEPAHEGRHFRAGWVKLMATVVGNGAWPVLHRYPEQIHAWVLQIHAADDFTLALESTCLRIREEISSIDYDDGWATDKAGAALESVTLALQPGTRWMAHAADHVWRFATGCNGYNDVVRLSERAWLQDLYNRTAAYARTASQSHSSASAGN